MAQEVLADPFVRRFGSEDTFRVYYTCIPSNKHKTAYECVKGKVDTRYSLREYPEKDWMLTSVSKLIPKSFHESYLSGKHRDRFFRIVKDSS